MSQSYVTLGHKTSIIIDNNVTNEQRIISKIKAGDNKAMKSIYDLHIGYLMGVCTRYIRNREDAKDILQDSFIKIFKEISRFTYQGEGSFRAWATRIVINESITFIRKTSNISLLDPNFELADEREDVEIEEIPIEVIHKFISELPDGYRIVFNLYAIEGKSHREIAETLNIKENTSASQYFREKKLLASWINEYRKKHHDE